jgi:YVTN family beta-propeller protein
MKRLLLALALVFAIAAPSHAGRSNSLMDVTPDSKWLIVVNSDNGTVTVVDAQAQKVAREITVGEKPEGVTWIGNGPLAIVTVYWSDELVFVNADEGKVVKRLKVSNEPYGVVANKAGTKAWVTHDYWGTVSEIDVAKQQVAREFKVAPYVRGICLSNDEKRLYVVGYYSTMLYAVDIENGKIVDEWKPNNSQYNLARQVIVHPTRPKAYIPHMHSRVQVAQGAGSIFPQLSIVDLVPPRETPRRVSFAMDTFNNLAVPTNPWECEVSPDGKTFYIIYAGTNDMNLLDVVNDDYKEVERRGFRALIPVGQNPRAVRCRPDGKVVYVSNALDFEVGMYDPQTMKRLGGIKVCQPPKTPEWVRGKILFNTANAPLTARRWIACSSCHPDGNHDGRTWQNPEGLRRTTALFGLAHTHPLHWSADRDESQDFEYTIRGPLMGGRGLAGGSIKPKVGAYPIELEEKLSGRSKDLDAMAIYTNSFEFRLSPYIASPGKLSPAAERGRSIFHSKEANCASCHSGPYYSDSTLTKPYKVHDVGTGGDDKSEKMGPKYDTPTLLGVYRQTEYLHHGKAKTLHEVLTTFNKLDKHGKTSHLKPNEIDDLVEFLKSLPFEKPPSETPNTVKDRVVPKPGGASMAPLEAAAPGRPWAALERRRKAMRRE